MSIVKSYSFPDGEIRGDMYYTLIPQHYYKYNFLST